MKSSLGKCVLASVASAGLLVPCVFLAVNNHGGWLFLAASGIVASIIAFLCERIFPCRRAGRTWQLLAGGAGRGALVGAGTWAALMSGVSLSSDPGDKFGIYVVFFSVVPVTCGIIAGGVARLHGAMSSKRPAELSIYEVIRWGGDGELDIVLLASARTIHEAAELADAALGNLRLPHLQNSFAQTICRIAADSRQGNPVILIGPCFQRAYDFGWEKWERKHKDGEWEAVLTFK